ncbi:10312_t:CDS:1, partial [Racocetra persica]
RTIFYNDLLKSLRAQQFMNYITNQILGYVENKIWDEQWQAR